MSLSILFGLSHVSANARGRTPAFGRYLIARENSDEPYGYRVMFSNGLGRSSHISTQPLHELKDAQTLAELHWQKRRQLICEYGDQRNVPRAAWKQFRADLRAWEAARPPR
jgi:hypothetical protein